MRCATPEVPICGLFEADPEIEGVPHGTRWANIDAVVDNCATKLVAPLAMGPRGTVLQSQDADRQRTFASAISCKLPNLGGKIGGRHL